jgi:hypothetical protein
MERVTMTEILASGLGIFAHVPDEVVDVESLRNMISYFEEVEMFEECAELFEYIKENYNHDGSLKGDDCDCDMPMLTEYTNKPKCSYCNKRLRR